MKFEFSAVVKGVPAAEVKCNLECTAEELVTLISDPVYQGLGQKFINEVSFAPKAQPKQEVDAEELYERVNRLIKLFGKDMEADKKARIAERELINKLMDRVAKLAERTQKF